MSELSKDAKILAASNLTLAFFIREHTLYSTNQATGSMHDDSNQAVKDFFDEFMGFLEKK